MKNEKTKPAKVAVKKSAVKVAAKPTSKATKTIKVVSKPVAKKVLPTKSTLKVAKAPVDPSVNAPDKKHFIGMMKDTMATVCSS